MPLLAVGSVVIVDSMGNEVWRGRTGDVPEERGVLPLSVTMVDYDVLENEFVIAVIERHDGFHEIELLLSDCLRYVGERREINYVAIMHVARRVAKMAETAFARVRGRLS